jgi:hypothetical protein
MERRKFFKTMLASAPMVWILGKESEATEPAPRLKGHKAPGVTLVAHEGWRIVNVSRKTETPTFELVDEVGYSRAVIYVPREGQRWKRG